MKKEDIVKELLNYSKAIIAFIVLQNLAFLYNLSLKGDFYKILRIRLELSIMLCILFVIILVGSIKANVYLSREVGLRVDERDKRLFKNLFLGKLIIIIIFQLLVIYVLIFYAIIQI